MSEADKPTKRHRRGLFWAGLAVRLMGLGLIWIGDGHDSRFRVGLVVAGVVLSVGGIAVLRYLLFVPLLSRLRPRHELPQGDTVNSPVRLSWWKRKRWWAAVAAIWLVAYPLSLGAAAYLNGPGWLSETPLSFSEWFIAR